MRYTKEQEEEIGKEFLGYCKKIGYGNLEIEVIEGIPLHIKSSKQIIHFERGLTKHPGNTTME